MQCHACQKQLPADDRFCAYCGAAQGRRLLPGLRLPVLRVRWLPSAATGAVLGGAGGALLGSLVGGVWFGLVTGAVALDPTPRRESIHLHLTTGRMQIAQQQ